MDSRASIAAIGRGPVTTLATTEQGVVAKGPDCGALALAGLITIAAAQPPASGVDPLADNGSALILVGDTVSQVAFGYADHNEDALVFQAQVAFSGPRRPAPKGLEWSKA